MYWKTILTSLLLSGAKIYIVNKWSERDVFRLLAMCHIYLQYMYMIEEKALWYQIHLAYNKPYGYIVYTCTVEHGHREYTYNEFTYTTKSISFPRSVTTNSGYRRVGWEREQDRKWEKMAENGENKGDSA